MHAAHLNNQLERVGGKLTHFLLRTKVNLLHKVLQIYPAVASGGRSEGLKGDGAPLLHLSLLSKGACLAKGHTHNLFLEQWSVQEQTIIYGQKDTKRRMSISLWRSSLHQGAKQIYFTDDNLKNKFSVEKYLPY